MITVKIPIIPVIISLFSLITFPLPFLNKEDRIPVLFLTTSISAMFFFTAYGMGAFLGMI